MGTGSAVKKVAIVGAGIGGLTLANALRCVGGGGETGIQEVSVFEKFDHVKPGVGGGIQINSGAVVLARLGLGEALKVMHFRKMGFGGRRGIPCVWPCYLPSVSWCELQATSCFISCGRENDHVRSLLNPIRCVHF